METILRSGEMAEIMLLPVRHHSPACALHIKKTIEDFRPAAILVEGPDNADSLLPVMVHEGTKAPFAIYYSYHDKTGKIAGEKEHYKCYYPFLDYSPELSALREADKRGIKAAFIDLPYGDILAASEEGKGLLKEEEKNNYNDDYLLTRNEYLRRLCEKARLRNFDEFWEKYFELNGLYEDSDTWFSHLLTYCRLARENTPPEVLREEGCLAREEHMAARIVQWVLAGQSKEGQERNRILVITGGFHTPALAERLSGEKWEETKAAAIRLSGKSADKEQSVYLMPYSMEAADALNGYASGMPFSGFYQKVWENFEKSEEPYKTAVLDLLTASGKKVRKKEGTVSTYDEICAWQMAQGLGALRGKSQPGAYELLDAVLSSYIKGEYSIASDMPVRILQRLMQGSGAGRLCEMADVPPILHDFETKCKSFGLKVHSTLETEITLNIFSNKKHRKISRFFHRMIFLDTTFARRIKGPNLQLKKNLNLIREIWKYKWNTRVPAALIDVSVHGATIEEAAASLVRERLKKDMNAGSAAGLLTQVFEMGLTGQLETVYGRVHELLLREGDFYSVADAVKALTMMEELDSLYQSGLELGALLDTGVQKMIALLPSMTQIKDESLEESMDALKLLNRIAGKNGTDLGNKRDAYYAALENMQTDIRIHPGLNGCICGILYGSGRKSTKEVEKTCRGYLTGTKEQLMQTAVFFRGLFCTAKDLIFIGSGMTGMLDNFFGQVDEGEFMELLPQLRMAFTYFTPAETDKIAQAAAQIHGKDREDIMQRGEIMPDWYAYGRELDRYAKECMESGITKRMPDR